MPRAGLSFILLLSAILAHAAAPPAPVEPLPSGAIARLGYARLVAGWGALHVSPDGRWAVCGGQCFDLVEGKQTPSIVTIPEGYQLHSILADRSYLVSSETDYILFDPKPKVIDPPGERSNRDHISFDSRRRYCLHVAQDDSKVVRLTDLRQPGGGKLWRTLATVESDSQPRISADGSRVLWYDEKRLWLTVHQIADGKDIDLVKLDAKEVHAIALSPDGKTAVCVSLDYATGYDTTTGKRTWQKQLVRTRVGNDAMFTPDGKYLVLPYYGGYQVIPADRGKQETRFIREPAGGAGVAFALLGDSKRIAVKDEHGVIRIRDLLTGKQLDRHSRYGSFAGVQYLSGHLAASWTTCGTFVVWDVRDARVVSETVLMPPGAEFAGAIFHPSGSRFIAWTDTGAGLLVEASTGKILARCKGDKNLIGGLFDPTSQRSAFLSAQDRWCFLRWHELSEQRAERQLDRYIKNATLSPNGRNLLCANSYSVSLVELASGKPRWELYLPDVGDRGSDNSLCLLAQCKGGERVVVVRQRDFAMIDAGSGRRTTHTHFGSSPYKELRPAAVSDSGRWLAVLEPAGQLRVFDLEMRDSAKAEVEHETPGRRITALALNGDGSRLITAQGDGTCFVWDRAKLQSPEREPTKLDEWDLLGHLNPEEAHPAIAALLDDKPRAVKLLAAKLVLQSSLVTLPQAPIAKWIKGLDAEEFSIRAAAEKQLIAAGDQAEEALQRTVDNPLSLEQKRRAERLLARLDPATNGEMLRQMRAVEVLERIGSKDAIVVMEKLAKGPPCARLTREAQESLARLRQGKSR